MELKAKIFVPGHINKAEFCNEIYTRFGVLLPLKRVRYWHGRKVPANGETTLQGKRGKGAKQFTVVEIIIPEQGVK